MKNKNIGEGVFCQLNLISNKDPNAKMRKNANNYQTLNFFPSLVSLTRHFTNFIFLEQLTAMPPSESSRVIFCLFCLHPVGQTFLYPSKFYNHLKQDAK